MAEKGKTKSKGSSHESKPVKLHKTTDPACIKKILKFKGSVDVADQVDSNGELPIHAYIKSNYKKKFECLMAYLIHAECDLDHHNHEGMTALHLACDKNDTKVAQALIAFGADINSLTQNTQREQTPLDIILEKRGLNSDIPSMLEQIGGKLASELKGDDDEADWSYELTTTDDCFTMRPVLSGGSVDPLELSDRLGAVNGSRDETDYHYGYMESERQLDSLQLSSLPDESIEMGLTIRSVAVASAKRNASDSPFTSLELEDARGNRLYITRRSPNSVSPLTNSLEDIAENQEEEEEEEEENPGNEASDEAITNGRNESCSPDEHADVIPGGALVEDVPDSPKRLVNYAFAGGSLIEDFEQKTTAVLNRGVEDSTGDEGYAAWLQYREIERAKKMSSGFMEFNDSNETAAVKINPSPLPNPSPPKVKVQPDPLPKVDPSPPFQPSPPPKRKGQLNPSQARGCRRKVLQHLRHHDPTSSVMKSLSTTNDNMEVTTSIMGHSVRPREYVKKTSKAIGQRVLCLDGGGIKGLVQIEILSAIEKATGKRITELFDWIVGTSTGGIIALGLVYAGLKLEDLRRMYFEMKDDVFKSKYKILSTVCDTEALEELLKKTLGTDKNMNSKHSPNVMITAVNKEDTSLPLVFFNNCFDDEFSSQPVWKVARYTSAAPVFFTECDNYVDGGVVANNPSMRGMVEIQDYFKRQKILGNHYEISCLVSVGCGKYPPEELGNTDITNLLKVRKFLTSPNAATGALKGLLTLLTTALTQSEGVARTCEITCENQGIAYYRFSPEMFDDVGTAERDNIKLCDMIISAKKMLEESSEHLKELAENLGCKPCGAKKPQHYNVV